MFRFKIKQLPSNFTNYFSQLKIIHTKVKGLHNIIFIFFQDIKHSNYKDQLNIKVLNFGITLMINLKSWPRLKGY